MRFFTQLSAALAALLMAAAVSADAMDVDLKAADGTQLKATYMSPGQPGPAMLLVHQCNMDRSSWSSIAPQLVEAGVHVLTLDLRGFGDSGGEGMGGAGGFQGFFQQSIGDVDLAYDYLVSQPGVDASRVAAGGASCGAMLSAELASRKPVEAIMLLSGPPSDSAIDYMAATSELAVFAAATRGDTITPDVADRLEDAVAGSQHPHSVATIYDGTEHGLPMFDTNAELEALLLVWLETELLSD